MIARKPHIGVAEMEDTLPELIELTAAELNAVAGGVAVAANVAAVAQLQAVGNRSFGGGFASVNVEVAEIMQNAVAINR
jgi:hypothetical protein